MPKGIYKRTQKSLHWQYKTGPAHPRWNGGKIGARYKRYKLLNQLKNKPCADCMGRFVLIAID